jgi:hypothetical protein
MAAMCNHRINRELWLFFFSAGLVRAGGVYIHPQTRMNPSYGNYLFMRKTNQPLELVGGKTRECIYIHIYTLTDCVYIYTLYMQRVGV